MLGASHPRWYLSSAPHKPAGYRLRIGDLPVAVAPEDLRMMFSAQVQQDLHPNAIEVSGGSSSGARQA